MKEMKKVKKIKKRKSSLSKKLLPWYLKISKKHHLLSYKIKSGAMTCLPMMVSLSRDLSASLLSNKLSKRKPKKIG
jgi:hypothetical protein